MRTKQKTDAESFVNGKPNDHGTKHYKQSPKKRMETFISNVTQGNDPPLPKEHSTEDVKSALSNLQWRPDVTNLEKFFVLLYLLDHELANPVYKHVLNMYQRKVLETPLDTFEGKEICRDANLKRQESRFPILKDLFGRCPEFSSPRDCLLEKWLKNTPPCVADIERIQLHAPTSTYASLEIDFLHLAYVLQEVLRQIAPDLSVKVGGQINFAVLQNGEIFVQKDSSFQSLKDYKMMVVSKILYDVGIWSQAGGHGLCLLIDNDNHTVEIFDPHGSRASFSDEKKVIEESVKLLQVPQEYKLLLPSDCPRNWAWQTDRPLCFYYSLLYLILRIGCRNRSREDILVQVSRLQPEKRDQLLLHVHCLLSNAIDKVGLGKVKAYISEQSPKIQRKLIRKLETKTPASLKFLHKQRKRHPPQSSSSWLFDPANARAIRILGIKKDTSEERKIGIRALLDFLFSLTKLYVAIASRPWPLILHVKKIELVLITPSKKHLTIFTLDEHTRATDLENATEVVTKIFQSSEKKHSNMELDAIFHWKKPLGIPSDAKLSEDTKLQIEWKDLRTNQVLQRREIPKDVILKPNTFDLKPSFKPFLYVNFSES
jgi:hypothetical protein